MGKAQWSEEELDQLKDEIIALIKEYNAWMDVCIYVNGKRYSDSLREPDGVLVEDNIDPKDYIEYVYAGGNILSMSFDGTMYELMNRYLRSSDDFIEKLDGILKGHGLYFEMGHAWDFTCCPV